MKSFKDLIFTVGNSPVPMTVETFDRAFRRRITIAISISIVLNAIVFGTASVIGHNFLHALQLMAVKKSDKKSDVTIRRVFVRDLPVGGTTLVPDDGHAADSSGSKVH